MAGTVRATWWHLHEHSKGRKGHLRSLGIVVRSSKILRACVLSFLTGVSTACYVYTPVASPPAQGSQLRLDLNDRGRVGLGGQIGASGSAVEGLLQPGPDSIFTLKVVSVSYLNGQRNQWTGEPLSVSRDFVRDVRARQFSKTRTALTVGSIAPLR